MNKNWTKTTKEEFKKTFNSKSLKLIEIFKRENFDDEDKKIIEFNLKLKQEEGNIIVEKYVLKSEFDPFKKEMLEFKEQTNNRLDKIEEILYINNQQIKDLTIKLMN
ncbi:hypothetical protein [Malacoplasma iowae]|uniref:hypothetical protein n=1 Tax=Malacoplasma iowae TaxID=2116 RepID=UPI002A18CAD9|nr:hypothetical protein [Malacoplasma iowae]WPL39450.1 hypothetical protein QX183_02780 [Malacoplasma iowae]